MKMLKRVAAGLAAAVLALGMLTACGSEKGTPQSWAGSNLGKVLNAETLKNSRILLDYTVVEGEGAGTRKYAIGMRVNTTKRALSARRTMDGSDLAILVMRMHMAKSSITTAVLIGSSPEAAWLMRAHAIRVRLMRICSGICSGGVI